MQPHANRTPCPLPARPVAVPWGTCAAALGGLPSVLPPLQAVHAAPEPHALLPSTPSFLSSTASPPCRAPARPSCARQTPRVRCISLCTRTPKQQQRPPAPPTPSIRFGSFERVCFLLVAPPRRTMMRALLLLCLATLLVAPPAAGQDAAAPVAAPASDGDGLVQATAIDPTSTGLNAPGDAAASADPMRLRPPGCNPDTCDGCEEYIVTALNVTAFGGAMAENVCGDDGAYFPVAKTIGANCAKILGISAWHCIPCCSGGCPARLRCTCWLPRSVPVLVCSIAPAIPPCCPPCVQPAARPASASGAARAASAPRRAASRAPRRCRRTARWSCRSRRAAPASAPAPACPRSRLCTGVSQGGVEHGNEGMSAVAAWRLRLWAALS